MTLAMIIISFFLGSTITAVTMRLSHAKSIRLMQVDYLDAITKQVKDSYEAGYMRCEIERAWRKKRQKKDPVDATQLILSR